MEELSLYKCLLTNDEIGLGHSSGISWTLIMELSFRNGSFKFLVEFVEIDNEVFGTG